MCLIDDFFLDQERVRKVVKNKIESELHFDFAARQAIEGVKTGSDAEIAVVKWMEHYGVVQGFTKETRSRLAQALINQSSEIKHDLTPSIRDRHAAITKICNSVEGVKRKNKKNGKEKERECTSLVSKLLWLLHPHEVPIFDSRAWRAINVIARIVDKAETPDPEDKSSFRLKEYCAFLKLHEICFSHLYDSIQKIVAEEFDTIFSGAEQQNGGVVKQDAANQYANYMTVIDQMLWHLGGAIPVDGCYTLTAKKKSATKSTKSVTSVRSPAR
jgi:hypothetical protein